MSTSLTLRPATLADIPTIFQLIQALAEYEKLSHAVTGSIQQLQEHLFGPRPYAEAILAKWEQHPVGFALFFHTYSTFLTQPSLYLEDIFVLPDYRRQGIGEALIRSLAQTAVERGCGRLEWSVLDWNAPAIAFYDKLGATLLHEWRICRLTGKSLHQLATLNSSDPL
jgi:GNAT superfamily N-acetyltransferase